VRRSERVPTFLLYLLKKTKNKITNLKMY